LNSVMYNCIIAEGVAELRERPNVRVVTQEK